MVAALFLFVSTQCLLHTSALITKAQVDDFPGDRLTTFLGTGRNAAGCFPNGLGNTDEDGVARVEDFKRILKEGVGLLTSHPQCIESFKNATWCKEPGTDPLLGKQDQKWYAELVEYLKNALAHTERSLPIVAAVWDSPMTANARSAQIMNTICGFERLGMSKRFVLFAANQKAYASFVRDFPNITTVFHPYMDMFIQAIETRTNVRYHNRMWKMAVAQMVLDIGRDVLVTDTDIAWIRDSSRVLHRSGLDFAAMKDYCSHDINTGFIYYRNVPKTRDLLHMSFSTWRDEGMCADNDQYLLNCGWKRAAIKGLNYKVLPSNSWSISGIAQWARTVCTPYTVRTATNASVLGSTYGQQMFGIGDGYPYVFHTYGMSTSYMDQLDMLAAYDMVDVDFKTGHCKMGPKELAEGKLAKSCSALEDGVNHPLCRGSCRTEPARAEAIVADLGGRSSLATIVPPPPRPKAKGKGHRHHHRRR